MLKKTYLYLSTPEVSGKEIGLFRTLAAIFGGLFVAYLGMTLLAFIIPMEIKQSGIISIMFNTSAWACSATWIALSYTKFEALVKSTVPSIVFAISLYFLY
ncbi:hypothetical protein [Aliarcobacter thereius]|uniref:DUF3649 domain-containing protein n=1 Tax=Aliarcobacter thereius LMG 24486 TaxID=1032240 RepID=A0A1C7WN05_9BACT|nr:hypothetical protein [Aliarcobacter thereius]OCL92180.1 hypothetical protein AAX25_00910 [Aliarcobacter thereius]OCL94724.1 hypothetical protein AA347_00163 [Aliarcobacter thereius LMG 24486]QBF15400.1 putative membrane protein [Aliarcobacter thereius LMG 24486]TLS93217.1 hypothetical protein FE244_04465 [Aliarcobacter thereius]